MQSSILQFDRRFSHIENHAEDRAKTIICGVLFLDIVEYSRKTVSGQISLKERFNAYLSLAIRNVPVDDRIILDTGDGAALSFLGDVEDALQVALSMRESLRAGMQMEPPLHVRMGLNLGPVRLVTDINGQINVVGDGINAAQRVMGFADPGEILVSRPCYDALSRLSSQHGRMFRYRGARTDKHLREHEIYAIGDPGEFTGTLTRVRRAAMPGRAACSRRLRASWRAVAAAFKNASPFSRVVYASVLLVSVTTDVGLIIALIVMMTRPGPPPAPITVALPVPAAAAPAAVPVPDAQAIKQATIGDEVRINHPGTHEPGHAGGAGREDARNAGGKGKLKVSCLAGTRVFVDGRLNGRIENAPMIVPLDAGKHLVMLIHPTKSLVRVKDINVAAGKSLKLGSDEFCR